MACRRFQRPDQLAGGVMSKAAVNEPLSLRRELLPVAEPMCTVEVTEWRNHGLTAEMAPLGVRSLSFSVSTLIKTRGSRGVPNGCSLETRGFERTESLRVQLQRRRKRLDGTTMPSTHQHEEPCTVASRRCVLSQSERDWAYVTGPQQFGERSRK